MKNSPFLFIGDLLVSESDFDFKICEHFNLKRANKKQIEVIKPMLDSFTKFYAVFINHYETHREQNNKGGHSFFSLVQDQWKYSVIEHNKNEVSRDLRLAMSLSSLNLHPVYEEANFGKTDTLNFRKGPWLSELIFFHDNLVGLTEKTVTQNHIEEIENIYQMILNIDKKNFELIHKAANNYNLVRFISKSSPFKVISYISILELLLTTYQGFEKAISQQLKNKIQLINNSLPNQIPIDKYFKGSDSNTIGTIIEKLYIYRNDIAHGNDSDFDKKLFLLKNNRDNIFDFLDLLLREILLYSLKHPQLIKDLKEC